MGTNERDSNLEVPKGYIWEDTLPFNNQFVAIQINLADLRRNFIHEAIKRGSNGEHAATFINTVDFGFNDFFTFLKNRATRPSFSQTVGRLARRYLAGPPLAITYKDDKGWYCFMDILQITQLVDRGNALHGFNIPAELGNEAKQIALRQALSVVWTHEREHLIQANRPGVDLPGEVKKFIRLRSIPTAIALTGSGLVLITDKVSEDLRIGSMAIGVSAVVGGFLWANRLDEQKMFKSWYEIEATKFQNPDPPSSYPIKLAFVK